jgi:predicted N-formylglutamate amidohydrolase
MKKPAQIAFVFTCEHASNSVPNNLKSLFIGKKKILATHRGWDIGALPIAQALARKTQSPLVPGKHTRLVIDLNRSTKNETLFSEMTWTLSEKDRLKLISLYHAPHWTKVHQMIETKIKQGFCVIHFGIHSFTPVLNNVVRDCEIGLLFDPKREFEAEFCQKWQKMLKKESAFRVRKNYPYKGTGDGMTVHLRKDFRADEYIGIEVEINQYCLLKNKLNTQMSELLQETLPKIVQKTFGGIDS